MTKLVATLGTSPGGILETFLYLAKNGVDINEIRVITTRDPEVEKAWKIVKLMFVCCLKERFSKVEIIQFPVSINDINTEQDLKDFKAFVNNHISSEDYVDITGGRKGMSVAAALAAKSKGAKIVTSIIPQDEYRRINDLIKQLKDIPEIKDTRDCRQDLKNTYCSLISSNARTIIFEI
ncbi:CRISPR-associated ring nuclease Crn1 [Sulfolobus acidocaldarius]|uniref:Conserved protein n=4 Tax=Sulfolobus acidocaldarius TaxID=2285 RepID=Q4J9W0_SULAC|nr:CRISPR-associated ring nuclease Crn1 [Sulfolobus acidocaldarius]AAY80420.1 conserved protein [Sulfolobus acidocaldarius DSM 639]AGE71004.1 hypothetical protein SacN8_05165 [Sulfolobus acidocaldarius N8]AGE73275.1 hypothetical protein SacRon12I_05155 [Sulfolobus acidocaldarius Ron12/I]ALU28699.1 hypothetical protein ATY89_01155 [Sulfolobus acidocaldarius]ALU31417.1 hypothetical protein ATZ20_04190 [Sulfolobus acidocaldarius]